MRSLSNCATISGLDGHCSSFKALHISYFGNTHTHTHTTVLWPFFRDHPGELVPEENFWTLWCQGRLTEADTPTIWLDATASGLPPPSPWIFTGRMPFLLPDQQHQSTGYSSAFGHTYIQFILIISYCIIFISGEAEQSEWCWVRSCVFWQVAFCVQRGKKLRTGDIES